jgi:DNA polymerase-1
VTGGRIHPVWSITRTDDTGARSGRIACSPNFQNLRGEETTQAMVEYLMSLYPDWHYWTPAIRGLVVTPPGIVYVGRDYSQIELRLVAHYEDGPMAANYRANPAWDLHAWVVQRVAEMFGKTLPRRIAKNIGFGSIYGAGAAPISKQSRISMADANAFRDMYFSALPSLKELMDDVMETARVRPITTLGGRVYSCEPPRWNEAEGRLMRFEYKMLNYLIQPSAADLMKEAMVDADAYGLDLVLSVHDEPVAEARAVDADDQLEAMRVAMEHNDLVSRISVPIISNGYITNRWSDAK